MNFEIYTASYVKVCKNKERDKPHITLATIHSTVQQQNQTNIQILITYYCNSVTMQFISSHSHNQNNKHLKF